MRPATTATTITTITGRIYATALELLERHPEGIRFTALGKAIEESDPSLHPKTVNGCVWKLTEKFPDQVCKPSKGLFRLVKYQKAEERETGASKPAPERG